MHRVESKIYFSDRLLRGKRVLISFPAIALLLLLTCHIEVTAIPLAEHRKSIEQTMVALDSLTLSEESESTEDYQARVTATLTSVKALMPLKQTVEWEAETFEVDNTWLHQQLAQFDLTILARIQERLKALTERLAELEKKAKPAINKAEAGEKLKSILSRSEYARKPAEASALARLWIRFLRWLASLMPNFRPADIDSGGAARLTTLAQILVVALALIVLVFVLKSLIPRFRGARNIKRKKVAEPRIVLGELLQPEASAHDLLTEAEGLARQGQIRSAIRKAYIALLVELGDRKLIRLAQHRTNRDYLRALKGRGALHRRMVKLTNSFERHWYGLTSATENDWLEFRAQFREALRE